MNLIESICIIAFLEITFVRFAIESSTKIKKSSNQKNLFVKQMQIKQITRYESKKLSSLFLFKSTLTFLRLRATWYHAPFFDQTSHFTVICEKLLVTQRCTPLSLLFKNSTFFHKTLYYILYYILEL